jgi:hypothetical protein
MICNECANKRVLKALEKVEEEFPQLKKWNEWSKLKEGFK